MPSVDDLTQSKYLKRGDVDPPVVVTITGYEQVNMAKNGEPQELRWVLKFKELDKPMTLNKTNGNRIAAVVRDVYGVQNMYSDFDNWIGKKIELFNDPSIEYGGKIVGGIRVRYPWNPDANPNPQQPAAGNISDDDEIPF